jgi:hypothetical protein
MATVGDAPAIAAQAGAHREPESREMAPLFAFRDREVLHRDGPVGDERSGKSDKNGRRAAEMPLRSQGPRRRDRDEGIDSANGTNSGRTAAAESRRVWPRAQCPRGAEAEGRPATVWRGTRAAVRASARDRLRARQMRRLRGEFPPQRPLLRDGKILRRGGVDHAAPEIEDVRAAAVCVGVAVTVGVARMGDVRDARADLRRRTCATRGRRCGRAGTAPRVSHGQHQRGSSRSPSTGQKTWNSGGSGREDAVRGARWRDSVLEKGCTSRWGEMVI